LRKAEKVLNMFATHKIVEWGGYLLAGIAIAFMPKCPACLAAYVALFTGLGLSLGMATSMWWFLIICCLSVLGFMSFRLAQSAFGRLRGNSTSAEHCSCCRQIQAEPQVLTKI
jgi:hypothetical protein